jgi:hypothetical protein
LRADLERWLAAPPAARFSLGALREGRAEPSRGAVPARLP